MALGVLTQSRGPHQQPIAYLSRELDVVSRGWPHCLRVIGAPALLSLITLCPQPLGLGGQRVAQTTVLHPRQPASSTCTALLPGRALGLWAAVAWSQLEGIILGIGSFFLTGEESMITEESMGRIYGENL